MISIDTNILVHARNADSAHHRQALGFVQSLAESDDVIICELVLVELYLLLRNPAVFSAPLTPQLATDVCQAYRANPHWGLVENAPVMEAVWRMARQSAFARRRIIDVRLALTLQYAGVTELATDNVRDFNGLGFARVWNPLAH
jgi:toxin-antitoxin system PIN domain toxin